MNFSRPIFMQWFYYILLAVITLLSFLFYSPLYHKDFNSDSAVHVLMAGQMEWPREVFYWGQNRLGSLLPLVSSWLVKGFDIHPLWAVSFVNHFFLLSFILVFGRYFKSIYYKIGFAILILFPFYSYNAILLVGHPYASQLFAISIAWLAFERLMQNLSLSQRKADDWLNVLFIGTAVGGMFLAVWTSEFSVFYLLLFILMFFLYESYRNVFFTLLKERPYYFSLLFLFTAVYGIILWLEYAYYKKIWSTFKYYKIENPDDQTYDRMFIKDFGQLREQFAWFFEKAKPVLGMKKDEISASLFYYSLMTIAVLCVIHIYKNRKMLYAEFTSVFALSWMIITLTGTAFLFVSSWNYRSEFAPRYFSGLYPVFLFAVFLLLENFKGKWHKYGLIVSGLLLVSVSANNLQVLKNPYMGVYNEYHEIEKLEDGVLIGNYWHVYKLGAVAPLKFIAVAHDKDAVRNDFRIPDVLKAERIYLIKNEFINSEKMPDSIMQFGKTLVRTGNEIIISDAILAPYRWVEKYP